MLENDWAADLFPTAEEAQLGSLLPVGSTRRRVATGLGGRAADAALGLRARTSGVGAELDRAAATVRPLTVDIVSVYGSDAGDLACAVGELRRSRHRVRFALGAMGVPDPRLATDTFESGMSGGKFANANRLLGTLENSEADWTLILDDDIVLPERFLDRILGVAESLRFDLAQPAQTWTSDAAWRITRRRGGIARQTRFVEVGPLCLMRREVLEAVTPFSEQGMGWGLCLHWAALARRNGWRLGIVDALAVRHERRPTASTYSPDEALAAAREFLATHDHINRATANEVVGRHARLP